MHAFMLIASTAPERLALAMDAEKQRDPKAISIPLHRDQAQWQESLMRHAMHPSIFGDRHLIHITLEEKDLAFFLEPWFQAWLNQNPEHRILVLIHGQMNKKHALLQVPKVHFQQLYPPRQPTSPGRDPLELRLMEQQPKTFATWKQTFEQASPEEQKQALRAYVAGTDRPAFLIWIDVLQSALPMDALQAFETQEQQELYFGVLRWLRQLLMQEESGTHQAPQSWMKWPIVQKLWQQSTQTIPSSKRRAIYLRWLKQAHKMKGYGISQDGWRQCLCLTAQWRQMLKG